METSKSLLDENLRIRLYLDAAERILASAATGRTPVPEDLWPLRAHLRAKAPQIHRSRAEILSVPPVQYRGFSFEPWLQGRLRAEHQRLAALAEGLGRDLEASGSLSPETRISLADYVSRSRWVLSIESEALLGVDAETDPIEEFVRSQAA